MDALTLLLAGLSMAGALYRAVTPKYKRAPADRWLVFGVLALVVWTAVQTAFFSVAPLHSVEYMFTNAALGMTLLLSRELGWRFRRTIWLVAAPVLAVATLEGVLGMMQFTAMRAAAAAVQSATGTYPNRNHFAGLLEMALPLALAGAIAFWSGRNKRWWGAAGMAAVAGLLVMRTVISLSRMGFLAALGGLFVLGVLLLGGAWASGRGGRGGTCSGYRFPRFADRRVDRPFRLHGADRGHFRRLPRPDLARHAADDSPLLGHRRRDGRL